MVATVETISEPELHGKRRRTSISPAPSVVKKSSSMNSGRGIWSTLMHKEVAEVNGGPTILTDQQFGSSDDLLIIHYSLVIERCARNRSYSPSLGRWINQDPAGYVNGANTYQFVMGNPVNAVDPWGLDKSDAFVNGLAAQLGGADWLNNQVQNTGQTGGQVLGQAIQKQVPAPLLAAANLPNAVNPHTLAEGLADTAQGVQNGLIGMINFGFNHGSVGVALHELQQWVKTIRGWPSNIPSPQWDPYGDPTKPLSEGLGAFAGPTLLLGPLGGLEDLGSPLTYSDRVLARMAEETGPYHNFPWSFDAVIISQGDFEIINGNYSLYTLPGSINGVDGFYEIGVNSDGQIVHRFFNPGER